MSITSSPRIAGRALVQGGRLTKWKGKTASLAPQEGGISFPTPAATVVLALAALFDADPSQAACTAGPNIVCSGTTTQATFTLPGGTNSVTIDAGATLNLTVLGTEGRSFNVTALPNVDTVVQGTVSSLGHFLVAQDSSLDVRSTGKVEVFAGFGVGVQVLDRSVVTLQSGGVIKVRDRDVSGTPAPNGNAMWVTGNDIDLQISGSVLLNAQGDGYTGIHTNGYGRNFTSFGTRFNNTQTYTGAFIEGLVSNIYIHQSDLTVRSTDSTFRAVVNAREQAAIRVIADRNRSFVAAGKNLDFEYVNSVITAQGANTSGFAIDSWGTDNSAVGNRITDSSFRFTDTTITAGRSAFAIDGGTRLNVVFDGASILTSTNNSTVAVNDAIATFENGFGGQVDDNVQITFTDSVKVLNTGGFNAFQGGMGIQRVIVSQQALLDGNVGFGSEADTLTMFDGRISGSVSMGSGNDVASVEAGTITGNLAGNDGDDVLNIFGFPDGGIVLGTVTGDAGDDIISWSGGTIAALNGGTGSDAVVVSAAGYDGSQVLDGGDGTSVLDGQIDALTLGSVNLTANGTAIVNWEAVTLDAAELAIADDIWSVGDGVTDATSGVFLVNGSVLDGLNGLALTGNLSLASGTAFMMSGGGTAAYGVSGNLTNFGLVTAQDGAAGDIITVSGNYTGGGVLALDVDFETDTADVLVIGGSLLAGPTLLAVNDVTTGVATGTDVLVVDVEGTSGAGDFVLAFGPLTSGAFTYDLEQQGVDWYLAGDVNALGAAYESAPSVLLSGFASLPTLEQRVGQRQWLLNGEDGVDGVWMRLHGENARVTPSDSDSAATWDSSIWGVQLGADFLASDSENGYWVLGMTGQYGAVSADVSNGLGVAEINGDGWGIGATATWYGYDGTYVDLQGQANWISADYATSANGTLASGRDATAYALSAELGHRIALDEKRALVPQAQLSWGEISGDAFTDSLGNAVNLGSNSSTLGRIGLAYEYRPDGMTSGQRANDEQMLYGIINILHNFSSGTTVDVAGTRLQSGGERTLAEIGLGGSVEVAQGAMLYGEASYRWALDGSASDNKSVQGTVGLRFQW